jgi:hypothetical protein
MLGPTRRVFRRVLDDGTDCAMASGHCEMRLVRPIDRLVLARVPLSFAGPLGPAIPMTLTADPSTNLADGQVVRITGSYFMPGTTYVAECFGNICAPGKDVSADADGTFSDTIVVQVTYRSGSQSFDCRTDTCTISTGQSIATKPPISFASTSPTTTSPAAGP